MGKNFLIIKNLIKKKELECCRKEIEKNLCRINSYMKKTYCIDILTLDVKKWEELLKSDKLSKNDKHILRGQFDLETRLNEKIIEFCCLCGTYLSKLYQEPYTYMHLPPMARFVIPGNRFGKVPAHRDQDYNTHIKNFTTLWVPLVDITPDMGGVKFFDVPKEIKELEKAEIESRKITDWLPELKGLEKVNSFDANKFSLGDALIFDQSSIHESIPNQSEKIRFSLDMRFFKEEENSTKPYINIYTLERFNIE